MTKGRYLRVTAFLWNGRADVGIRPYDQNGHRTCRGQCPHRPVKYQNAAPFRLTRNLKICRMKVAWCEMNELLAGGFNMYEHVGRKIKKVAEWTFAIETILGIVLGFVLMFLGDAYFFWGLVVVGLSPLVAWLSNLVLFGFGQLVENTDILREKLADPFGYSNIVTFLKQKQE